MPPPSCPDRNTLRALARGDLTDPPRAAVRGHVDGCRECAEAVRALVGEEARRAPVTVTRLGSDPGDVANGSTVPYRSTPASGPAAVLRWVRGLLAEPTLPDALGRVGGYEVVAVLGHGGMGVVLRGWDPRLRRPVAVKLLIPQLAAHPVARARFEREARAVAAVRHPNVVGIHEIGEQGGLPYLVMEFVDGHTLADRFRDGTLDAPTLVGFARQVADGLSAVHARGIVHRDVKPSNILVEAGTDRVVITDFGLALLGREGSDLTSAGHVLGTPSYMAPEQVRGDRADHRSDLFGLGCVVYAMAVGRSPFPVVQSPGRPAWGPPRPLAELRPDLPAGLSDLVRQLLAEDPADRPPSAAAVRDRLDGKPAPPANPPRRPRRRLLAGAAAAAVAGAAAAGVLGRGVSGLPGWAYRDPRPAPGPADRVPRTLTVAQTGGAEFRTIGDALALAAPGDTVRVLDAGTYREAVAFSTPRLASVTLEAAARATLAPERVEYAVTIKNTPGVVLRGFRFESPADQIAVVVLGPTGALLEDLTFDQPPHATPAAVYVCQGAGPALGQPNRIRNSTFRCGKRAVVVDGNAGAVGGVEVAGNRFLRGEVHVVVCRAVEDVSIRDNLFCRGDAVAFDLDPPSKNVRVSNNTCWLTPRWLRVLSRGFPNDVSVFNNLVLEADAVELPAGVDAPDLARAWSIHHNRWEPTPRTDHARAGAVAEVVGPVDLISRDEDDPNFLRPPPGSPLGSGGAGGELPAHVGAVPPAGR